MQQYKIYCFEKFFQGGSKKEFVLCTYNPKDWDNEEEFIQNEMESWGKRSDGGHSYGYRIYFREEEKPTEEDITKLIKRYESSIKSYESVIERSKEIINYLQTLKF